MNLANCPPVTAHQTVATPHLPWPMLEKTHQALVIATDAHGHQRRKDGTPFLQHPLAVWRELLHAQVSDENLHVVALLHDVLEERTDERVLFAQRITHHFGEEVCRTVRWLSDRPGRSSEQRKADQLRKLPRAPWGARVVKLADRVVNLRSGPAPGWCTDKTAAYARHSQALLNALRHTHKELEFYVAHELAQPVWQSALSASAVQGVNHV